MLFVGLHQGYGVNTLTHGYISPHLLASWLQQRIVCEHVIGKLTVFEILAEQYRNRRRRLGLRIHLLAAIYNLELRRLR
jgi:hypothetical protein